MKLKSLILGSVAAAGLSTAGFAADLGVLTSLDVCDELGLSGLTISSDTNCLQISGEVKYEFSFGDFNGSRAIATPEWLGSKSVDAPRSTGGLSNDWESRVQSYLKFVGTAGSDFGPASVVVKIKHDDRVRVRDGGNFSYATVAGIPLTGAEQRETGSVVVIDEAYVQVGDSTVLTAGKRGSIFNKGDDEPFNFTGLFIADRADKGVIADENADFITPKRGGHVIQLWSNIADGLIAKIGLENLNSAGDASLSYTTGGVTTTINSSGAQKAGTLVGVLDYSGAGITAHISGAVGGILDGERNNGDTYLVHTGVTATFDQFKVRGALAVGGGYSSAIAGNYSYWNGLISGEAKFDMFKVALSAEAAGGTHAFTGANLDTDFGFGGSFGATVAEGIEINIGGRYFNDGTPGVGDGYQVAAQLVAALTETIKLTTEIGVYGTAESVAPATPVAAYSDFYGKAELGWKPGGGFESSVGATVQQNGAYKVTFKASKAFQ